MNNPTQSFQPIPVEEVFEELMKTEAGRVLAHHCYYEQDVIAACNRFAASEEWKAVVKLISSQALPSNLVLDVGAGNGIGSYALARNDFEVVAVEPDPSTLVGYGALHAMVRESSLPIFHCDAYGEDLPFKNGSFGLVYCRQVLHHARDLNRMVSEIARVLKNDGIFIACREHVIDDEGSRNRFLAEHPLHHLTMGEGAFTIKEYSTAIKNAGFSHLHVLKPWDTVINHYPISNSDVDEMLSNVMNNRIGSLGGLLSSFPGLNRIYRFKKSFSDRTPGRLFTFTAKKPAQGRTDRD